MNDIAPYLRRIPLFSGVAPEAVESERLGGLTNLVYRLSHAGNEYLLRVPGDGTAEYIDRKVEAYNARVAADAGVSARVLFADEDDGLMLCEYISGCVTMSADAFRGRHGSPGRAALALRAMHRHPRPFQFRFELFAMIDEYLGVLAKLGAELPDGYHDVVREAEAIRKILGDKPLPLAPCHCDPLAENFLDNGQRMWVVDWEYSGMNDPIWDLGDLSVEAELDADQDAELMQAYCGGDPSAALTGRMVIYKAMCDLLWTLWGLIQHANDNPAEDFWAYSTGRFERCKALMGDSVFATHLGAVQRLPAELPEG